MCVNAVVKVPSFLTYSAVVKTLKWIILCLPVIAEIITAAVMCLLKSLPKPGHAFVSEVILYKKQYFYLEQEHPLFDIRAQMMQQSLELVREVWLVTLVTVPA